MAALSQDVVPDLQQENARLSAELRAAQNRQNATAEILRTIASSPGDADRALQKIAHTSAHLFDAASVQIQLAENGEWGKGYRFGASAQQVRSAVPLDHIQIGGRNLPGAVIGENRQIHIADLDHPDPTVADFVGIPHTRAAGTRTICGTPLRQNGDAIGVLVVYRDRLLPFRDEELALQQTFADQAVIAIQNARLFNESRDALERQTATTQVLQIINSSPGDLAPAFDAILAKAHQLCGVAYGSLQVYDGERFRAVAVHNLPEQFAELLWRGFRGSDHPVGRAFLAGDSLVHLLDCAEIDHPVMQSAVRIAGIRTALFVPLRREEALLGMIVCGRREIRPFDEKEISLLESFATQAVVAIENARLINETREALERQTATADILKVIASSPSDVQPVFEAIAMRAKALLGGFSTAVFRFVDDVAHLAAFTPTSPAADEVLKAGFPSPVAQFEPFRLAQAGKPVQIAEIEALPNSQIKQIARARGFRSMLLAPLMSNSVPIGLISVTRLEAGVFVDHHVQLLQTFADQAVIAIENARLFEQVRARTRELSEALQQQTATADVLKIISRSAFDLQTVLDALLSSACRLCDADIGTIRYEEEGNYRLAATYGCKPEWIEHFQTYTTRADRSSIFGRTILDGHPVRVSDVLADPDFNRPQAQKLMGFRAALGVPLIREGHAFGVINLFRFAVGSFEDKQIELVATFADQAVIAIENARLFNQVQQRTRDLTDSLQQQTAIGEVLKTISRSTFDLQPVLDTLVRTVARLCDTEMAYIMRRQGSVYRAGAAVGYTKDYIEFLKDHPITPDRGTITGRAVLERRPIQIQDVSTDPEYRLRESTTLAGQHTALCVPLLREGEPIGTIVLARQRVEPFTEKQIELVTTFADQAVIAIENVRLFEQLETKRRDLAEALTYQTGSANILKVIASSPTDVGPVMKAIVESACELCDAADAVVLLRDGNELVFGAQHGSIPMAWRRQPIDRRLPSGRAIVDCEPVHVHDLLGPEGEEFPIGRELARHSNVHTILSVPLLREDESIGAIALRRTEVTPFNEKQIALLQTFADQAVIAIGNVRLFEEVQERTRELTESLEQQTATSEVLQVISSSPGELEPVFRKMLENATRVCGANFGVMNLRAGDSFHIAASYNVPPEFAALRQNLVFQPHADSGHAALLKTRQPVQFRDVRNSPAYLAGARHVVEIADIAGARTIVLVPMLKDGEVIGCIIVYRTEVRPFTEKQIGLIESFTKQAVIAIENTRLLKELRQRTDDLSESLEQQTATSEVLATISSSAGELKPVFNKMLENATRICGARFGTMNLYEDGGFRTVALFNAPQAYVETRLYKIIRPHAASGLGTVEKTHETVHIDDIRAQPPYIDGNPNVRALAELGGARTLVIVPMLKEDELIGTITIFRQEVKPFTAKQIELVSNFASQAVIAIENARLLNELRERTKELSQSLEELRTAQDRLVQTEKLASLGQLTAGIAHEIKNPLNFVNNFSALSSELIGELNETLRTTAVDEKARMEIDELTQMLQGNLEKIVQHGKRADSIVKNMLLHSRQGSGERRPADINAIVEESLNLAYHGARAEKPGFNIALERDLDATAEQIDLYPQEITRVLLNLISNGFYAATKRKEAAGDGFEPRLSVTTRTFGGGVEIRIRDNGSGIPLEVKEKIFNPFFTTKPAGDGTGLGLSICHDIIVKQHGGSIDVVTEPGVFTEFIITLPRAAGPSLRTGG